MLKAVRDNDLELFKDSQYPEGRNDLMHIACNMIAYRRYDFIEYICDLNFNERDRATTLELRSFCMTYTCRKCNVDVFKLLVRLGVRGDLRDLYSPIEYGNLEIVKGLLKMRFVENLGIYRAEATVPVSLAIRYNKCEILDLLISHGFPVNIGSAKYNMKYLPLHDKNTMVECLRKLNIHLSETH